MRRSRKSKGKITEGSIPQGCSPLFDLPALNWLWYHLVGAVAAFVVGCVVSVLTGGSPAETARLTIRGQRVKERGGTITALVTGDYYYSDGYARAQEILKSGRPAAIFCAEDSIAMGAMDAAKERFGLRVPEDTSIMGFDDISVSAFHAYSLTTMRHPQDKIPLRL